MRHISSYKPRAASVFLTLGLSLVMAVAGCTAADSSPTSPEEAVTSTVWAAEPDRSLFQEYSLVDQIMLPVVELPPLPPLPQGSLTELLLPNVELPALPAVGPASQEESIFDYLPAVDKAVATDAEAYNIFTGPNYTDKVVLTFDDCPGSFEQLEATVAAAQANDIGLVLAPTGVCIDQFQQRGYNIIDVMRERGQYVINHSVSHPAFSSLSRQAILDELAVPGVVTNYGRPPYGDGFFPSNYSPKVADVYQYANMRAWLWTVDTEDWKGKSAAEVVSYVTGNSYQQDTVLMHMNHNAFNPESIVAMKAGLNARGLEVCSAYSGTTPGMLPDSLPC